MIRERVPLKGQRLLEGKEAIPQSAARAISVLLLSGVLRPFFSPYLTGCGGAHALVLPLGISVGPRNRKWNEPKPRTETNYCHSK